MQQAILLISIFVPFCLILMMLIFWTQRRHSLTSGNEKGGVVRTASLNSLIDSERGGWWIGLVATLLPIAGSACVLAYRWQTIPARYPIHWGLNGHPNGWGERSVASVFGQLIVVAIVVLVFGLVGELIGRSSAGHYGRSALIRTTRIIVVGGAWVLTILICWVSLLPLTSDPTQMVPFIVMTGVVMSLVLAGYAVFRWQRMPEVVAAAQDSTDGRYWRAGIVYYNSGDSAIWVPKKHGFGYTLNFARPVSWLLLGLILLIPVGVLFFVHESAAR
jgi:uncharacterized membrane protein